MRSARPFGDRGLADAGLADQHRIVLGPAGEHLDGAADFLVAADDRVELALARRLGEVARIFLQRVVAVLGALRVGGAAAAQLVDRGVEVLRGEAGLGERAADVGVLGQRHRQQDALDRDVAVAGLLRDLLGLVEDADGVAVERRRLGRAAAGHRRDLGDQRIDFALRRLGVAARGLDQPGGHALLVVEQRLQQMRRRDPLMMLANRDRLRGLQEPARAVGELLKIHSSYPSSLRADMVLHLGNTRLVGQLLAGGVVGAWRRAMASGDGRRCDGGCGGELAASAAAAGRRWRCPPDGRSAGIRRRPPGPCSSGGTWCCRRGSAGRRRSRARHCMPRHAREWIAAQASASAPRASIGRSGTMSIAE